MKPIETFDNDMQRNVAGFAECLGAVVNGLSAIKGGRSLDRSVALEPPIPFAPKPSVAQAA